MGSHSNRAHAILSASGAHRWLACTPSAMLESRYPNTTSEAAEKGTLAHELAELKVKYFVMENITKGEFDEREKIIKKDSLYEKEMDLHTDLYIQEINRIVTALGEYTAVATEHRVDMGSIIPNGFGTVDFRAVADEELHIVDYKNGRKKVEVKDNPQLMLYAFGEYMMLKDIYDIKSVFIQVVQPKVNNYGSQEIPIETLLKWVDWVKERAEEANEGTGQFVAGDHCYFCKVKDCRCRAERSLDNARKWFGLSGDGFPKPDILSEKELAECMKESRVFHEWYQSVEEYILNRFENGETFSHIAVEPTRGRSKIPEAHVKPLTEQLLKLGWDSKAIHKQKLLPIGELKELFEEAADKEAKRVLDSYIVVPTGKPKINLDANKEDVKEIFKIKEEEK